MKDKTKLGQRYQECITGFTGIAAARCEYLTSNPRIMLVGMSKDGIPVELWTDEENLVVMK